MPEIEQPGEQQDVAAETLSEMIGARLLSTATAAATAAATAWAEADATDAEDAFDFVVNAVEIASPPAVASPDTTCPATTDPLPQERRRASTTVGARYAIRSCLAHAVETADTKHKTPAPIPSAGASSHRAGPSAYPLEEGAADPLVVETAIGMASEAEAITAEGESEVVPGHLHSSYVNAAGLSIHDSVQDSGTSHFGLLGKALHSEDVQAPFESPPEESPEAEVPPGMAIVDALGDALGQVDRLPHARASEPSTPRLTGASSVDTSSPCGGTPRSGGTAGQLTQPEDDGRPMVEQLFFDSMPRSCLRIDSFRHVVNSGLHQRFLQRVAEDGARVEACFFAPARPDLVDAIFKGGLLTAGDEAARVFTHAGAAHACSKAAIDGSRLMFVVLVTVGGRGVMPTDPSSQEYAPSEEDTTLITHLLQYTVLSTEEDGHVSDPFTRELQDAISRSSGHVAAEFDAPRSE